jgi:hypothetical protein
VFETSASTNSATWALDELGRENRKHSDLLLINYSSPNTLNASFIAGPNGANYTVENIDVIVIPEEPSANRIEG